MVICFDHNHYYVCCIHREIKEERKSGNFSGEILIGLYALLPRKPWVSTNILNREDLIIFFNIKTIFKIKHLYKNYF